MLRNSLTLYRKRKQRNDKGYLFKGIPNQYV